MPELFDNDTNRQGLIVYGSVNSSNYGIVVGEPPAFERPTRKQTIFNVPGRNGSVVFQEDAWEDVTRTYNVWLSENIVEDSGGDKSGYLAQYVAAFEEALNSQNGWNMLQDNFEPDIYRLAYYSGGDGFSNELTQYGRANLRFVCRPERFLMSGLGGDMFLTAGAHTVVNPTKFVAKPIITIIVPSPTTIKVAIGSEEITAEVTDYINIDCETMNAYRLAVENMNNKISGKFPTYKPGSNTVTITGTITSVDIQPRWYVI